MTNLDRFVQLDELRRVCAQQCISLDLSRDDAAWLFSLAYIGLNAGEVLRELRRLAKRASCPRPPIYPGEWDDLNP